ncbi:MAG: hypothetical protein AAGC88_17070, partial [Bacteroidota bacterium]
MEPILEDINNPTNQSFNVRRYENSAGCPGPGWHIHPEYELVMIPEGSGSVYAGGHFSSYEDGLLIFLGPYIPHMPFRNSGLQSSLEVVMLPYLFRKNQKSKSISKLEADGYQMNLIICKML